MRVIAIGTGLIAAIATHVFLGWVWSASGALLAGFLAPKRSAWIGAVTLVMSWGLLVSWNLAVATAESFNMMETMGSLLGGMPGIVVPLATLLVAALIGLLAGALGGALRPGKNKRNSS
jgi:hypothetical protein